MSNKNKLFTMTREEVAEYLKESENFKESNHPIEGKGDFMDMLIEGAEISLEMKREKKKQDKKNDTKKC